MKFIDLTIPLGVATPPWPTYEPLQLKYFKRLAPNGANGQVLTHSNHLGTHLDGEIHFHTPGKDIASLDMDFLVHEAAVVDLSDVCGDYDVYTSKMVDERVEVREGDILIIPATTTSAGIPQMRTRCATWSNIPALTVNLPSGQKPKNYAGSVWTAEAPTIR
jgi:kynurenine formamidase